MDSERGIELKQLMFGDIASRTRVQPKDEIAWRKFLTGVFAGFGFEYHPTIEGYVVDYLVEKLGLILECNGEGHRGYNKEQEKQRDRILTRRHALVRFHNLVSVETLFNGILQAKPGKVIRLYNWQNTASYV